MSLELDKIRERLQPIVAPDPKLNRNGTPKTDGYGCCLTCGAWTPYGHPEAHDHRQGCSAEIAQHEYQRALQAFIKAAPADITTLLSQVDRFAPANSWRIAVEKALGVQPDPVNHDQDWAHRTVLGLRELGNGVAPEAVDRLLAGLPSAKGGELAGAARLEWVHGNESLYHLVLHVYGVRANLMLVFAMPEDAGWAYVSSKSNDLVGPVSKEDVMLQAKERVRSARLPFDVPPFPELSNA